MPPLHGMTQLQQLDKINLLLIFQPTPDRGIRVRSNFADGVPQSSRYQTSTGNTSITIEPGFAQSQIHQTDPIPPHPEQHSASWNRIKKRPASEKVQGIHQIQEAGKRAIAAHNFEQDFMHLLDPRYEAPPKRTTEAITGAIASIPISESQLAMEQAQRVKKMTFLAYFFVPLSFTTSFFGMNVEELQGDVGLKWWDALTLLS
ncbi:hypothetical protein G7Y79_00026g058790 [Physcia stellaris]|nr:hypothetical protein G7Y79_00026g058790 [Physcia stellaris]